MRRPVQAPGTLPPASPYSPALDTGAMVFVSGQVSIDPTTGRDVEGGFDVQARQVLANIQRLVDAAGLSLSNVARVGVYLTNGDDFNRLNEIYREVFAEPFPARATVVVAGLARPWMVVEMDAVAVRD